RAFLLRAGTESATGLRAGARRFSSLHSYENRQVRDCMHATMRAGPLQHEGLLGRDVAGRLRQVDEGTSSEPIDGADAGWRNQGIEERAICTTCQRRQF